MKSLTLLFVFIVITINAQDFDIYPKNQDDYVKMPYVHESMRLNEFQILSRNPRMMDMAYSVIVPGYMHFKAKEKRTGYILLGSRLLGYVGLGAVYYSSRIDDNTLLNNITGINENTDEIQITDDWSVEKSDLILAASITVIFTTYMYDWIHGKVMLEKKQEYIRYKYSVKLKLEQNNISYTNTNYSPAIGVSLTF